MRATGASDNWPIGNALSLARNMPFVNKKVPTPEDSRTGLTMRCPTLAELPPPPPGRSGWPWTIETPSLPSLRPDGSAWPRISIVTPSYNQGQFIEETIRSTLLQGYPNLEYVIVDGGSTDCTVEIVKRYEPWITYWISEKDRGQAHAINKGLANIRPGIFNWINSDDLLMPSALRIIGAIARNQHAIAGGVTNFSAKERVLIPNSGLLPIAMIAGEESVSFHQPGLWLRSELVLLTGGIDETLHYAFDFDLVIRYLSRYPTIAYTQQVVAMFRLHDTSKTCSNPERIEIERLLIYEKLLSARCHKSLHCSLRRALVEELSEKGLEAYFEGDTRAAWRAAIKAIAAAPSSVAQRAWLKLAARLVLPKVVKSQLLRRP